MKNLSLISHPPTKPLFIPLMTEYFEQFKAGIKEYEYRPYGKRWNINTCYYGREVVLSKGYGKSDRLKGVITSAFMIATPPPEFLRIYGSGVPCFAIKIKVSPAHYQPGQPFPPA